MPNPRKQDRELDALYATLPKLECQGYCYDSCGPVPTSVRENARIVQRARKPLTCHKDGLCSMLTADHRCSVYEIRPMICRLWGLVRRLPCPYGCRPEGGLLDDREGMRLIAEAERIGGTAGVSDSERRIKLGLQMLDAMSDDDVARIALATLAEGRATLSGRLPTLHRTGHRGVIEEPGEKWGAHSMAYKRKDSQ